MQANWAALEQAVAHCARCRLSASRTCPVLGEGSQKSGVLFVGEAGAGGGPLRPALCGRGGPAFGQNACRHPPKAGGRVHCQRGKVPPAGQPHPCPGRSGGLPALLAPAVCAAAAAHYCLPGGNGGGGPFAAKVCALPATAAYGGSKRGFGCCPPTTPPPCCATRQKSAKPGKTYRAWNKSCGSWKKSPCERPSAPPRTKKSF